MSKRDLRDERRKKEESHMTDDERFELGIAPWDESDETFDDYEDDYEEEEWG